MLETTESGDIPDIILFESDDKYRLFFLKEFERFRARILCPETLEQVFKHLNQKNTIAAVFHNHERNTELIKAIKQYNDTNPDSEIPLYIWGNITPMLKKKYEEVSIADIFPRHIKPKEIYSRIMSSSTITIESAITSAHYILDEIKLMDNSIGTHFKLFNDDNDAIWAKLNAYFKQPLNLKISHVLIDMFSIPNFSTQAIDSIIRWHKKFDAEFINLSIISPHHEIQSMIQDRDTTLKIPQFDTFADFEAYIWKL